MDCVRRYHRYLFLTLIILAAITRAISGGTARDSSLQSLAARFFTWRARTQPCTGDDIPRVERPGGWVPAVSRAELHDQQRMYREFRNLLRHVPRGRWDRGDSVDYLLLRSAIERIHWELDVLKTPFRNPDFYVDQTLGAVYELLLVSSPMNDARVGNIFLRLRAVPGTVRSARENLSDPVAAFAKLAIGNLSGSRARLERMAAGLVPLMDAKRRAELPGVVDSAATALEGYVRWLEKRLPGMTTEFNPGRKGYEYYLKNIALNSSSPEELKMAGKSEFERALFCELMESRRNADLPRLPVFATVEEQIEQSQKDEIAIRRFLEERDILTVPQWMGHYRNRPMPPYVEALASMGVTDDLTSENRLSEDGIAYLPPPSPHLPFFRLASAMDPRPIIIHEGVPGHYFQLCVAWAHEDPIRRRYIDSGPIEGFGFYVEEMLLQAGLFDTDRTRTRETIYRFMRLRALRVEVDIRLALGEISIEEAAEYLEKTVPLDRHTALGEAAFFASTPGQAISYQTGKLQITTFLAAARLRLGDRFRIREFHDYLAKNGNVPIPLLQWEYLGERDRIRFLWPGRGE